MHKTIYLTLLIGLSTVLGGQVKSDVHETVAAHGRSWAIAPTPPMGWNSWDSYGLSITEQQFRDNVDELSSLLKPYGWKYAMIDEGWFLANPEDRPTPEKLRYELDAHGRYIPVPSRFPSAITGGENRGFAGIGRHVHSLGLKFGIHIVRGIPRESVVRNLPVYGSRFRAKEVADTSDACPWDPTNWGVRDNAAGQAWYDSLLAQYAGWGVDYLKVDCIADHPYQPAEIRMIHRAIAKTGRRIVLSLSPGPTSPGLQRELPATAQMWRISDDVWDVWRSDKEFPQSVYAQFQQEAAWSPMAGPDAWPDADMLPIGYLGPEPGLGEARASRLTFEEQRTMITLWSIARSPLILGANLTRLNEATKSLLTNRDVLALDQYGHDQRQVTRAGGVVAWTSEGKDGRHYLAIFNLNDKEQEVDQTFRFYNLPAGAYRIRDVWAGKELPRADGVHVMLQPHTCLLLALGSQGA